MTKAQNQIIRDLDVTIQIDCLAMDLKKVITSKPAVISNSIDKIPVYLEHASVADCCH